MLLPRACTRQGPPIPWLLLFLPPPGCVLTFFPKTKTLTGRIYAGQGRQVVLSPARNAAQESRRDHRAVDSGRAERGSECCWLSQRGSNWVQGSALLTPDGGGDAVGDGVHRGSVGSATEIADVNRRANADVNALE